MITRETIIVTQRNDCFSIIISDQRHGGFGCNGLSWYQLAILSPRDVVSKSKSRQRGEQSIASGKARNAILVLPSSNHSSLHLILNLLQCLVRRHADNPGEYLDGVGGCGGSTIGSTVGNPATSMLLSVGHVAARTTWNVIVVANVHTEGRWVNVAVTPKEQSTKDRLGHQVKDTVKDGLAIGSNDVAALAETPGNGVQEPEEDGPNTANHIGPRNVRSQSGSVLAADENDVPCHEEQGKHAKGPVSPLVRRAGQGANETSDNHDLVDQKCEENSRPWESAREEKIQKQ